MTKVIRKQKHLILLLLIVAFSFYSCNGNRKEKSVSELVNEWIGKEILFPENLPCYVSGKDTLRELCNELFWKEYKIVTYVDSTGCSSCQLKLSEWKQLIEETDSLYNGKVGFLLFFQPKSMRDMYYLFVLEKFNHPVFIDTVGVMNRKNHFPKQIEYQCFLLDNDNKVLAIGNPVSNPNFSLFYVILIKIWKQKHYIQSGR